MIKYISLIRGINVSGKNPLKMESLRKMLERTGFQNAATYVQSGNVVFEYNESEPGKLEQTISRRILKEFGYNVDVIVLNIDELKQIIERNPFIKDSKKEKSFMHVTFLSSLPGEVKLEKIENKKQPGEEVKIIQEAIYLYCPNGYGRTGLNNNFLENILKVKATTRNWRTVNELYNLAMKNFRDN